jgi:phosphatidylinositol alpha-1,6-mannosyltransferase
MICPLMMITTSCAMNCAVCPAPAEPRREVQRLAGAHMKHLLVTNDFPPKVGGIQSLLWEWWRRLDPSSFAVLTSPHPDAAAFDAAQPFRIERTREPVLLPQPFLVKRINSLATEIGADYVVLDPAVPLGLLGASLTLPYMVVVHGAEVTVPGRLPVSRLALRRVLSRATLVIAAGSYPAAEARHAARGDLPITVIPPGVDTNRFVPLSESSRASARRKFDVDDDAEVIVGVSRLVPRKGFDVLIEAAAIVGRRRRALRVLIGGAGRDHDRLAKLITATGAPVTLLGRVSDVDLPLLYGCADISAMLCRSRWAGLEQEGFGIVFAEAASCGVPQLAGDSGGAAEAVSDGETGFVVRDPRDVHAVANAITRMLDDTALRERMGIASRLRAETTFSYDVLSQRLGKVLNS